MAGRCGTIRGAAAQECQPLTYRALTSLPSHPPSLPTAQITFLHFFTWFLVLVYLAAGVLHKSR